MDADGWGQPPLPGEANIQKTFCDWYHLHHLPWKTRPTILGGCY